jgi:hypothetical protein
MGVYLPVSTPLATGKVLIANLIRLFQATGNVCFGSRAVVFSSGDRNTGSTASERKPAAQRRDSEIPNFERQLSPAAVVQTT